MRRSKQAVNHEVLRPEDLVRRETKVVNFLRALLITVLVVVGALLSFASYKVGHKWEEEAYERDFHAIASRLTDGFKGAVTQAMWNGYTIGVTVSASTDLVKAAPNITIPHFDQLATGAVQTSRVGQVYWAPLIRDEAQRLQWEAYAQQQMNVTTESKPQHKVCHVCGSDSLVVSVPSKEVVLPIGAYTCGELEWGGNVGLVPEEECPTLTSFIESNCACFAKENREDHAPNKLATDPDVNPKPLSHHIFETVNHDINSNITKPVEGPGPYSPIWQVYPIGFLPSLGMYDLHSDKYFRGALEVMLHSYKSVFSQIQGFGTLLFSPVFSELGNSSSQILGSIILDINWITVLESTVPLGSKGIYMVLENSCGQKRTIKCTGVNVNVVGFGDLHDPAFSSMMEQTSYDDFFTAQRLASPYQNGQNSRSNCGYRISVYASNEFRSNYISNKPRLYAIVVSLIFVFTSFVFIVYDCYVARRQRKVMKAALQRDEIVSSLFPAAVRERLFRAVQSSRRRPVPMFGNMFRSSRPEADLTHVLNTSMGPRNTLALPRTEPIADFFPNVTIVFADISGFTAWSSEREPSQVFQLLETVYQAFDKIAAQFGVFKIETIGDCYVAVAGLPMFQPDHALRVVKFAYECILHMHVLTHELEATLGPSTSSLALRVGVHSGPVTAGVLRGEKSRFQLFGDTVNTTARMQTTGENNRVQISNATAVLLEEAKMSHWIRARDTQIAVKGKGLTQTFWAEPHLPETASLSFDDDRSSKMTFYDDKSRDWGDARLSTRLLSHSSAENKKRRLVEWNTELLLRLLKKIVAARRKNESRRSKKDGHSQPKLHGSSTVPFEEVNEIISMHDFADQSGKEETDPDSLDLGDTVRRQLQDYVAAIAAMYHENPFHNFEHASHVALSASKVVMRIIKPNVEHSQESLANRKGRVVFKKKIHNSTFGISSDVLMQFAVVFSAVIHDVDHIGVSNAQLVKEDNILALRYSGKCVAEQNSVDIAWELLMKPQYNELLQCICGAEDEMVRFRQLLVNAVLATDIADKELQQKRKKRWDKAFHCGSDVSSELGDSKVDMDRKATIVFEYIIQASDVAHTMQHWKVYTQWNERLFEERYKAYLCGREEHDPSVGWYKGEIWFFDNYIIPLATKLETCGVFGVSSDEFLSYAMENRHEWELKGEEMVESMVAKYSDAPRGGECAPPNVEDHCSIDV